MTIDISKSIHHQPEARETNIFLGLGSNLGHREANLALAIRRVTSLGLQLVRASSIYETEPVGYPDQPWFLNQVIEAKSEPTSMLEGTRETAIKPSLDTSSALHEAADLLRALLRVETEMGRERSVPCGPRLVDIDLLLFGELVANRETTTEVESPGHTIVVPHPRMHLRRFVLEPLCEIAGELIHPVLKKNYRQLLAELEDRSVVRLRR